MSRPNDIWRLLNLPCDGMTRLASQSLDRDLTLLERLALRLHMLYCSACRRYLRQISVLRNAMRHLQARLESGEPFPGTALPDDVRDRIKRALRSD
jgi:predicted anti-sigma-YlaC factor YlaD